MHRALTTEESVVRLWEAMAGQSRRLVTAAGEHLRVLFPGRRNRGPGPDFRDAVLASSTGRIIAGDVEVHVRPQEWTAHGHQRDPQYNNLVLHVVLRAGKAIATTLEFGFQVPLVALEDQGSLDQPIAAPPPLPCAGCSQRLGRTAVAQVLAEAGEARFRHHSQRWQREIASVGAEETLYRGLMEALGYSANREPFRKLALLLPCTSLHRLWQSLSPLQRLPCLQMTLLAAAGLGPTQGEPLARRCRELLDAVGVRERLRPQEWRLSGLRPSNRPERRLQGMAVLLHQRTPLGLLPELRRLCERGQPRDLEMALTAWGEQGMALIGQARARDMVVNVVLPFFHALGASQGLGELAARTLHLYQSFPTLQANHLTDALVMRLFDGAPPPHLKAPELQGMLHLHQERCVYLRCAACPLAATP